ncbi:MAG: chromosome segregation protein SMC [Oscillospiraceae bacterium]|nr:chromosome segregation protein SMC [Oscillospiraceae bacterium]
MKLKALELHGFKSFPDKTRLEFGPGITCVVGPNGSGKSNVSDAVRWVLGEQSTKTLRGAKMEDVIFSGTDRRKAQGYAEVTLHLDNSDRALIRCDQTEVTVTRRLYRSGDSDYVINGQDCRLKDVHELFMDTGLGRDGYSLVGQGRVAELISSRSSQRREMLEEAAGISQSRYRRAAAMHKLEQAEENLIRLRDILAELEGRVGPLKVQKEKAEQFLLLAERRKRLDVGLALQTIAESVQGLREQEQKITKRRAEYELTEQDLARLEADTQALQEKIQDLTARVEAARQEQTALDAQGVRQSGEIAVLENTIAHNRDAAERLDRDRVHAADSQQQMAQEMDDLLAEISRLRRAAAAKREEAAGITQTADALREEAAGLALSDAESARRAAAETALLAEQRVKASAALSSMTELSHRMAAIDAAETVREEQTQELQTARAAAEEDLHRRREQVESMENTLRGYQMRAENRVRKAQESHRALETKRTALQQKQTRVRMLEDLEKNMEGYTGSVRAVIRESQRGSLRGLHGTLSMLISVPERYSAAIETALGAALQHIVADSEDDAKRAIAFLQRNNAGRATFLPLSAIRAQEFREQGLDKRPGFVNMADRLVQADPRYDQIIKAQLARTAIAEDIDSAVALAKGYGYRFKIVTLDGQVINAGGSMTGGSRGQGAGILSRGAEIAQLKEETVRLAAEAETAAAQHKALTQEAAAAEADASGLQGDLARGQEELIRRESQAQVLRERLADAGTTLAELEREKAAAAGRIGALEEQRDAAAQEIARIEARQLRIQTEAREAAGRRMDLEARRQELSAAETRCGMDLLSVEKDIEAREEQAASLRQRRFSQAGRDKELAEERDTLLRKNEEIQAQIQRMRGEIGGLREASAAAALAWEALQKDREAADARGNTLRGEEKNLAAQKERLGGDLARLEERRDVMRQEHEDTAAQLYNDYQLTPREAEEQGFRLENPADARQELQEVRGRIRGLGNINVDAIEEYREVSERYAFMSAQVEDIEESREELLRLIQDLTGQMAARFREQFERINRYFGETFAELFSGGRAELRLENPLDVLECAIEIRVQPPGKNVQNIDLLSGGEKGLAAIALLFAILKTAPAPFCIFDEVEAALDDVNVVRYARYVRRMTKDTQFILISHRRGTMEEADALYGVTMQEEGVSKLLEMNTKELAHQLGVA